MKEFNIDKIDLSVLEDEINKHENRWIAISDQNKIVSSGKTYSEAVSNAKDQPVVLLKVPRLDVSLAP